MLTLIMLLVSIATFAYDFESGGIYYTIISEENKTVEVASENNTLFQNVTMAIEIPSNVKNDDKTYTVTTIGYNAFIGCSGLTSATIPGSVTTIGDYAFSGCSGLTSVSIPNSVTTIGAYAFNNCGSTTSVTIGSSVNTIGRRAFINCSSLISILVDGNNLNFSSIDGILYNKDASVLIAWPGGRTSVTIPNSVTTIGNSAFYGCKGITSMTIPGSVTTIESDAFQLCRGLTSVTIPNSVTTIGDGVFHLCSGLTSMTIGNSVTTIGDYVFNGCSRLINIFVDEDNQNYRSIVGILYNKDVSALIACPAKKESVTIPNTVTSIGCGAFFGCSKLTTVTIPNSVTTIGESAFESCSGLTSVSIPNSVTEIGGLAFYKCSSMKSVTIGNSVKTIGRDAFANCSGLTSVSIPNSVTTIGNNAFIGCSSMTSVTIGSSVKTIDYGAFQLCSSLTTIYCRAVTPPEAYYHSFDNTAYERCTLYVPTGSKTGYEAANPWREFLNIEEMDLSGLDDVASDANADVLIKVVNGAITVGGIADNELITVYDMQSRMVYSGMERTITGLTSGVYIVKVGTSTAKVSL